MFRDVLMASLGARAIKSTRFDVRQDHGMFVFNGTGHGHGVGACQTGAMARARAGHDAARILAHYYPGTRLQHLAALRRRPDTERQHGLTPKQGAIPRRGAGGSACHQIVSAVGV